jgi:predicted metal-dependent phosphoesterase TrpH
MFTRREFLRLTGAAGGAMLAPGMLRRSSAAAEEPGAGGAGRQGVWLAGDFHCHTIYSHDVWQPSDFDPSDPWGSLQDSYTWGWTAGEQIAIAESRELDYLAVTDHNRIDALWSDDYASDRLVLVPGYEHSLRGGHAGVFTPHRGHLDDIIRADDGSTSFATDEEVADFLRRVAERDGTTVLNHPFYGRPAALAWDYGLGVSLGFDAVEIWNIHWLARHDTIPFADSDNEMALDWWESEMLTRERMPVVGGSDNHWRATTAAQGVGQPTTWVYAADRTPQAILEAVRAGRTTISSQPPGYGGPRLTLTATEQYGQGRTAMVGDTVRGEGPIEVVVEVERGSGNRLRVVSTGETVAEVPVASPASSHQFDIVLPEDGWVRAELYADRTYWMSALTSPIYARGRAPDRDRREPTRGAPISAARRPMERPTFLPLYGDAP